MGPSSLRILHPASTARGNDRVRRVNSGAARAPSGVAGNELQLGASFGISIIPMMRGAADLLANSDLAMYRAKQAIGNKVCFFEVHDDQKVRERRTLANHLAKELELYYQVQSRSPRPGRWFRSAAALESSGALNQRSSASKPTAWPSEMRD